MTSGRRGTRSTRPPSQGPANCGAKTHSPASAASPLEPVRSRIHTPAVRDIAVPPKPASTEIATKRAALSLIDSNLDRVGSADSTPQQNVNQQLTGDVRSA